MNCPVCGNSDSIKLNIKGEETDIVWDGKVHFPKKIVLYFCRNCNNVFGDNP